jgi:hypothetical protein
VSQLSQCGGTNVIRTVTENVNELFQACKSRGVVVGGIILRYISTNPNCNFVCNGTITNNYP